MAEFVVVMKQMARMCAQHMNDCAGCRLYDEYERCPFEDLPEKWALSKFVGIERIVMDWAATNPEPEYPSWEDAWNMLFPKRAEGIPPCPKYFVDKERINDFCPGLKCADCRKKPIPADIAEKLRIKPIKGSER